MSQESAPSRPHWLLTLVGSGVVISMLTMAGTLGRYGERVDAIAKTIEENGATGKENQKLLTRLELSVSAQELVNADTEKRLDRLEGKQDAIRN